ncbi:MAG TPA: putative O-glycosylation ligase, exosortase A system-associated [Phycisphaerae bacterium]|nr:putative O-glycosylation ligase, exosortase A system-associated [Phycisphaerae bacterium]HRW53926.1 putative O-glycosylation ligase, exosortase A system-associated [Phycisphaerae bacterium]
MRFILYASILFMALPIVLYRPFFGLCVYYIVSILQPKILCWRGDFQDALIVGVPLVIGAIAFGTQKRDLIAERDTQSGKLNRIITRIDRSPIFTPHWIIALFAVLVFYIAITRQLVEYPTSTSSYQFKSLCKIFLVTGLLTGLVTDYPRLRVLFIVIGFSAAFWAIKGGVKVLIIGPHQVYGKSYDNNLFALISVMSLPLVFYSAQLVRNRRWRFVILACTALICIGIIGSRSRAGFAAFAVVVMMMAWGSRYRMRALVTTTLVVTAVSIMVGPEMIDRIESIMGYREDKSAYSRFFTWTIAKTLVEQNPIIGVGFGNFEEAKDAVFGGKKAAHSIYLSNMSELGMLGHPMWLFLIFGTMASLWRFTRKARRLPPDMAWPYYIARALMLSLIAFAVHGAFHNEEYLELMFTVLGLAVALHVVTRRELKRHGLFLEAETTEADAKANAPARPPAKKRISPAPTPAHIGVLDESPVTLGALARSMRPEC